MLSCVYFGNLHDIKEVIMANATSGAVLKLHLEDDITNDKKVRALILKLLWEI